MHGIIVVDKPAGITSFDVVKKVRRHFRLRRVGHSGTLDPLATGLLVVLLGKDTKLFPQFSSFDKAYEATFECGVTTTTGDIHGKVIERKSIEGIDQERVRHVCEEFVGAIDQVPPMVSALKFQGRKLYEFARKGMDIPRQARPVTIHELTIQKIELPFLQIYLHCSKGTYVRSLACDIGAVLGCGACVTQIRRVRLGPFRIQEAVQLSNLHESYIRHWPS